MGFNFLLFKYLWRVNRKEHIVSQSVQGRTDDKER